MTIVLNGTTGITNDGGYTGDGVVFADTTPANTLVTTTGGNVGIGTSSPSVKLEVKAGNGNQLVLDNAGETYTQMGFKTNGISRGAIWATATDFSLYTYSTQPIIFYTNTAERARIDSSGRLLVGTTSGIANGTFCVKSNYAGAEACSFQGGSNNFIVTFHNTSGTLIGSITGSNGSTTSYNTSSDYRLKEDIQPMTGALTKVAALKPVTYKWKADGSDGQGFIAHELAEVCPDAVSGEKDEVNEDGSIKPQGIDTSFLVATLTAAIQELKAINDAQAETITALTARVTALEGA